MTDDNPQPPTFVLANGDSQLVTFSGPGIYTISEQPSPVFRITFSGDCTQVDNANEPIGTISAGGDKTCTITNHGLVE